MYGFYQGCFKIVQLGFNEFMDLIFKRYSSPFILLDELIENEMLSSFIDTLIEKTNEDLELKVWLHKVYDQSFSEFISSIHNQNAQIDTMNEDEVKTTVKKSHDILSNFQPQE